MVCFNGYDGAFCGFINEITSHTRTIATGLLKVARVVENAPTAILEDDRFKKMFESARQLLGFKAQQDQHLTFSQQEDTFWGNPEFLNAADEMVRAVQKRTYLNDFPSFSLGLTQEEKTQRWDDVSVVARDYNECEQSKEGEKNQVADDGALGDETAEGREGSEDRANEGERAQAREADSTAQVDEVTPDQIQQGSASNSLPPLEIPLKDQGKRPVVEYSPVRPRAQELFRFESRVIHWSDMLLLKPNTKIPTSIIDAWASILNHNEEDRLSARLFASTWTTLYTLVNPLGDEDERYKKFNDSYLVDKTFAAETRWRNIQHFLFPIIAYEHYYMINFDPLCERFDAIDNSSSVSKTEDKYGDVPKRLVTHRPLPFLIHKNFIQSLKYLCLLLYAASISKFMFLSGLKSSYKAKKIQKLKVKRMKMAWRDNRNKIDCGVFLMRHMETFRCQLPELWNCGLQKENKDQLNALRVKYLTALVMSDLNEHRAHNIQQAAEFGLEG
nr:ulp1 protease family, C-terminal catalytic domain-containing protein [Ipomoea batatas]